MASNWKRTRALSSPVMASSAVRHLGVRQPALRQHDRVLAHARVGVLQGLQHLRDLESIEALERPERVQAGDRRRARRGERHERRRGVAPLAVHEQPLRRAAPPDVRDCRARRPVARRWPMPELRSHRRPRGRCAGRRDDAVDAAAVLAGGEHLGDSSAGRSRPIPGVRCRGGSSRSRTARRRARCRSSPGGTSCPATPGTPCRRGPGWPRSVEPFGVSTSRWTRLWTGSAMNVVPS